MRLPTKIKCPKCSRLIPKHIVKNTNGKCNNCGYLLANSITLFLPNGNGKVIEKE
jgi:uncharacterized Zn finger protein